MKPYCVLIEELVTFADARNMHRLMQRWQKDDRPYNQRTQRAVDVYCEQLAVDLYREFRGKLVEFTWRAPEIRLKPNTTIQELNKDLPLKRKHEGEADPDGQE